MSTQDAQRSEIHATTEDATSSPTNPASAQPDKQRLEKAVFDTDLQPAKDDSDVGGPLRLTSDEIAPRKS
jgi:hypothetical protein